MSDVLVTIFYTLAPWYRYEDNIGFVIIFAVNVNFSKNLILENEYNKKKFFLLDDEWGGGGMEVEDCVSILEIKERKIFRHCVLSRLKRLIQFFFFW